MDGWRDRSTLPTIPPTLTHLTTMYTHLTTTAFTLMLPAYTHLVTEYIQLRSHTYSMCTPHFHVIITSISKIVFPPPIFFSRDEVCSANSLLPTDTRTHSHTHILMYQKIICHAQTTNLTRSSLTTLSTVEHAPKHTITDTRTHT